MASHYKDLIVWQKSINLVSEINKITKQFPTTERYALTSQMQRAAVSIPSNLAEGQARNHKKEFLQFLGISFGSAAELERQLIIAKTEYENIDYTKAEGLLSEVQKMLATLIKKLSSN